MLTGLSESLQAHDREGDVASLEKYLEKLWHLLLAVTASRFSPHFPDRDRVLEQCDIDKWNATPRMDLQLDVAVRKWRHWRAGQVSTSGPLKQRELQRTLRQKWGELLLSHGLPVATRMPYMAAIITGSASAEPEGNKGIQSLYNPHMISM